MTGALRRDPLAFIAAEIDDLKAKHLYRPLRVMSAAQGPVTVVDGREVEHAFLGVRSSPAAGADAGALIVQVEPDSPADDAGLEQGDLVVAVDGNTISSATDLVARIRGALPGDEVTLGLPISIYGGG